MFNSPCFHVRHSILLGVLQMANIRILAVCDNIICL